jgi:hypothetical protein
METSPITEIPFPAEDSCIDNYGFCDDYNGMYEATYLYIYYIIF